MAEAKLLTERADVLLTLHREKRWWTGRHVRCDGGVYLDRATIKALIKSGHVATHTRVDLDLTPSGLSAVATLKKQEARRALRKQEAHHG